MEDTDDLARDNIRHHPELSPSGGSRRRKSNVVFRVGSVSSPPVLWFDERHRGDDSFPQLVPHFNFNLRTLLVPPVLDVPHRNILLQSRGWDSGGDGSNEVAR